MIRTLGICVGATTIQHVELAGDDSFVGVAATGRVAHEGNPASVLERLLASVDRRAIDRIALTGRAFRSRVRLSSISEPEAVECALAVLSAGGSQTPDLVASAGGESQLIYRIGVGGVVLSVHSGNKCASGTGEFFMQQIRRMGLDIEQATALAREGTAHRIAGRCSVFCKSDCTHALNKGAPKADIAAGLSLMMAEKVRSLAADLPCERMLVIGGGCLNAAMVGYLRTMFAQVDVHELSGVFEAYGAALWARSHECIELPERPRDAIAASTHSFSTHPPLSGSSGLVEFKDGVRATVRDADRCVAGLDVGSTTTKAVVMRVADAAIVASTYLRTNGDPVSASRECYRELARQLGGVAVHIESIGVTGSGRQIAGLHALSDVVVNEIIAHAAAAVHFDPSVDTIFEIGGQDAKYTHLTAGVASDYAMNEACSAGTGSFLEEAARETLGVEVEQIAGMAMRGMNPPDFRDECAAFIASDIKLAGQEGVGRDDILAGLVYSICLNYLNRVKGARPAGRTIFMQGGVCYNRAVPVAMAACMQAKIVVPPEPGLMGALGAALEARSRLADGRSTIANVDLRELSAREVGREGSFVCAGGPEKCDRKCQISRFRVEGRLYPFGGACDRYYNMRLQRSVDAAALDFVERRRRLMFETYAAPRRESPRNGRTVGLNRSFVTNSLFPLFSRFFGELGFDVVLCGEPSAEGDAHADAPFCFPALIAHSAFAELLARQPDYVFLPQVMQVPVPNVPTFSRLCVFVQGEPYYLRTAFREQLESSTTAVVAPVLTMESGYAQAEPAMVDAALRMGVAAAETRRAWASACEWQVAYEREVRGLGREALALLEKNPDMLGMVLFGRPYNAMVPEANMGVPHKIASRGHVVLTMDMLDADERQVERSMFWASGQRIMKAAEHVAQSQRLFGVYITNFSCGPDSFLLSYFRDTMGARPSLTLELDQHTATAGLDTRIEAAMEIMQGWLRARTPVVAAEPVQFAQVSNSAPVSVTDSAGTRLAITSPRVEVLIPPMGHFAAPSVAAVMRSAGIHARVLPDADRETLLAGRRNATCKECLPYLVTTGSFIRHLEQPRNADTVSLLFIPTGGGPCRLGQYREALRRTIEKRGERNVAVLSVTDENGYAGLGTRALLRAWQAIVTADVFEDMRSMLAVCAADPARALEQLDRTWAELIMYFEGKLSVRLSTLLNLVASRLARIELARDPSQVPCVALIGEYYVRKEEFSRRNLVAALESKGFMVRVTPAMEYLCYSNYNINNGLQEGDFSPLQRLAGHLRAGVQEWWEWRIKSLLAGSGLYRFEMTDVARTITGVRHLVSEQFRGETLLTVGTGMREILEHACGVVSIGPFGCMPSRMAEAILKREMTPRGKARMPGWSQRAREYDDAGEFPFLSIETDGNPFPQIVEANLEAFVLQARRLHERMRVRRSHGRERTLSSQMKGVSA